MILAPAQRLLERLASPLDVDAYLSTIHPLWGQRTRGRIVSIRPVGVDAASLRIQPGRGWQPHRPGQFVTLGVDVDGVRHHRSFTLTSVPGDPTIEITVQASTDGTVSRHLVHDAAVGDVVQLLPAAGGVDVVDLAPTSPLLFVAGGSGITPTVGILRSLDRDGVAIDAVVLHHSVSPERALFTDELDRLAVRHAGLRVVHVHSRPDGSHRLDADRLDERCSDWATRHAHVCGPESMLDAAEAIWRDAGLGELLHLERFHPARPTRPTGTACSPDTDTGDSADAADGAPNAVAWFSTSDVVAPAPADAPLLEVAESAGLTPAFGCRMGICRTCTTRLDSGCVRDLRDGRTHGAGEHVQLCVSAADGDVVLDL
jgi:ferredoxin-NADP reductase